MVWFFQDLLASNNHVNDATEVNRRLLVFLIVRGVFVLLSRRGQGLVSG